MPIFRTTKNHPKTTGHSMKHYAIAAAVMSACGGSIAADGPEFKFSGFGTLSAVHSNDENSDFVGSIFQPNGAGKTNSWSFGPDSKLGGQINAVFNPQWSAVLQVVAQHQHDNSWNPMVEWANVKYQATDKLSLRLGRIATPSYLLSESRFVGYANPWVRPPQEAYSVLSITNNDGIDGTYRSQIGSANNTFQIYYGTSTAKIPGNAEVKGNPSWGLNESIDIGSLTLRAGYTSVKLDTDIPSFAPLFTNLAILAPDLASKYPPNGLDLSALAVGASYDPGDWFLMSELVEFKGDSFLSDSTSWYVSAGYRFGKFTPYVTLGGTKAHVEPVAPGGLFNINDGLNTALYSATPTQKTASLGIRWDFMQNMALKAQYDRIKTGDKSTGRFRIDQGSTAFKPGTSVNVFTVALDFVF